VPGCRGAADTEKAETVNWAAGTSRRMVSEHGDHTVYPSLGVGPAPGIIRVPGPLLWALASCPQESPSSPPPPGSLDFPSPPPSRASSLPPPLAPFSLPSRLPGSPTLAAHCEILETHRWPSQQATLGCCLVSPADQAWAAARSEVGWVAAGMSRCV
jgi:hypothetical protein